VSHSIHLSPAPDAGPFFETAQHTTGWPLAPPHRQLEAKPRVPEIRELLLSAPLSMKKSPAEAGLEFQGGSEVCPPTSI
jgi:hypothetical protein